MRTGLLFLVLQSLLLCNAVQAEVGLVETREAGAVAGLVQTGGDARLPPAGEDGGEDLQLSPAIAAPDPLRRLQARGRLNRLPFHTVRGDNAIRAPPSA